MGAPTNDDAGVAPGAIVESEKQASHNPITTDAPIAQATRRPWRDVHKVHPAAELFPLMNADELRELADDIKKNGLQTPIVMYTDADGKTSVLDGRNRLDAMELVGVDVYRTDYLNAKQYPDPFAWVVSANIRRRHLTVEQKREVIAALLKATPEKSDRQIATTAKVDHKTVSAVRNDLEGRGEIPHVVERRDTKGRAQPATKKSASATPKPNTSKSNTSSTTRKAFNATTVDIDPTETLDHLKAYLVLKFYSLTTEQRTSIARKLIAHLQVAYIPTPIAERTP